MINRFFNDNEVIDKDIGSWLKIHCEKRSVLYKSSLVSHLTWLKDLKHLI